MNKNEALTDFDGLVFICIAFDSAGGIQDIELLDEKPTQDFIDGYLELGVKYEIRSGYINGGDSRNENL